MLAQQRDVFSFWAPLDQEFLMIMGKLARLENFQYVSPFGFNEFFSYLTYTPALDQLPLKTLQTAGST